MAIRFLLSLVSISEAASLKHCGTEIPASKLPQRTLLFYEHDESNTNKLMRHVVDEPTKAANVVFSSGPSSSNMVFGGPTVDYTRAHIYLFAKTNDATKVKLVRIQYISNNTEVLLEDSLEAKDSAWKLFLTQVTGPCIYITSLRV